ncbi:mitochondrial 54S ribosomal protein mL60 [Limtongia smithiae]|uniref:mitochondrial 54S ribosomal protein mL60 n=1 Tax=Limtongia smithiae TaxID=1125753 RepID=UPI0034CF4FCC
MFGPFRASSPAMSGLLWKIPWRMSAPQKYRQRRRLRAVDNVIDTVEKGLEMKGLTCHMLERLRREVPREEDMDPKDKYTTFSRKERFYRKGLHKMAKWTRRTIRVNPKGF